MPEPSNDEPGSTRARRVVVIMGPGRSGTSTMAGAMVRCGFEVPGRAIRGNTTNPSGFYEPRWVVNFHRRLLEQWHVGTTDTSPGASRTVKSAVLDHPEVRTELGDWLATNLASQPYLVVKDPRGLWFHDLWVDVLRELDVEPDFVTMLRHPAEVAASRHKSYRGADEPPNRDVQIRRIAGWINGVLTAEVITRGTSRINIRYVDLLTDWRDPLDRISRQLNLSLEPPVSARPHPVDEFIDPSLRTVHLDRAELDIPDDLRHLSDEVWETLSEIAIHGESASSLEHLDELRSRYRRLTDDAAALIYDGNNRRREQAKSRAHSKGLREGRREAAATNQDATSRQSLLSRIHRPKT